MPRPSAHARHSRGTTRGTRTSATRNADAPIASSRLCFPETATPIAAMPKAKKSSSTASDIAIPPGRVSVSRSSSRIRPSTGTAVISSAPVVKRTNDTPLTSAGMYFESRR